MKRETDREGGFTRVDALVTIIVITVIVTTLPAALVPAMNKAREAAMRAQCANHMRQIGAAVAMYADAYDNWLPFYGGRDPNFNDPFGRTPDPFKCTESPICTDASCCPSDDPHPYAVFRGDKDPWYRTVGGQIDAIPLKLGCLYRNGIITDARIFYCPASTEQQYQYESYVNPSPPNTSHEWGTLPQEWNTKNYYNQWVRTGYTYFPSPIPGTMRTLRKDDLRAPVATARRYDKLDPNIPYLADVLWYRATMSHKTESGGYSLNALFKDGHVVYCKDRRFFSYDPVDDPQRLWERWELRLITFNYFYYNFLKKIAP